MAASATVPIWLRPGFGPQRLTTLAAYALRRGLLEWLETFKVEKEAAATMRVRREVTPNPETTLVCLCGPLKG